jgi:hypothetical protein
MKGLLIGLLITSTTHVFARSIDCSELGPQAELSISISTKASTAKLNFGEVNSKTVKLTKHEAGGAVAIYSFKHENSKNFLTIYNDKVNQVMDEAGNDERNFALLSYGKAGTESSVAMGCEI